jgi:membrane dipeptidase
MTPLHCEVIHNYYNGRVMENIGLPEALPWKFFEPSDTPLLLSRLLEKGYDAETVRGIMGENFLRVAESVWR